MYKDDKKPIWLRVSRSFRLRETQTESGRRRAVFKTSRISGRIDHRRRRGNSILVCWMSACTWGKTVLKLDKPRNRHPKTHSCREARHQRSRDCSTWNGILCEKVRGKLCCDRQEGVERVSKRASSGLFHSRDSSVLYEWRMKTSLSLSEAARNQIFLSACWMPSHIKKVSSSEILVEIKSKW